MRELPGLIKIDFAEFLRQLNRYGLILLAISVFAAAAGYFLSRLQTPVYQTTARILVTQPNNFQSGGIGNVATTAPLDVEAYREAALTSGVIKEALGITSVPNAQYLDSVRKQLRVRLVDGRVSGQVLLTVRDTDINKGVDFANKWAAALQKWEDRRVRGSFSSSRENLEGQVDSLTKLIKGSSVTSDQLQAWRSQLGLIQRDLDAVRVYEKTARGQLSQLEPAEAPSKASSPRPLLTAILAGTLTFAFGLLYLFLREISVRTVRGTEETAELTGLPILGEFPKLPANANRNAFPSEPASYLRTYVNRSLMDEDQKVIAVTSPDAAEGKSSVAIALAKAYARTGKRTLLIDLDLHKPVLHTEFGIKEGPNIVSVLKDPYLNIAAHRIDRERQLFLLPCLTHVEEPAALLAEQFRPFLKRLRDSEEWDAVIIDTAPVLAVTDTLVIAPQVSGVVMVAKVGVTNRRRLMVAVDSLRRIGARVLGITTNQVRVNEAMLLSPQSYSGGYGTPTKGRTHDDLEPRTIEVKPNQRG